MKLSNRGADRHFADPDRSKAGTLIYGFDPLWVEDRKDKLISALVGPLGKADLRVRDISSDQLRSNPNSLGLAIKEIGLFSSGQRVVCIENPSDSTAALIGSALDAHQAGDAWLVVTARSLRPASKLRKTFETHANALAAAVYADAISNREIEDMLRLFDLGALSSDASRKIFALGREMPPQLFRQLLEKIRLFKLGDDEPLTCEEVEACAPDTGQVVLDSLLDAVADRQLKTVVEKFRQVEAQGIKPATICVATKRIFKNIYAVACDPEGPVEGVKRLRPPAFGPRRDSLIRRAKAWGPQGAEKALLHLSEADRTIRSDMPVPPRVIMERSLLRVAMMGPR